MNVTGEYCSSPEFVVAVILLNIIQLGLFHLMFSNIN